MKRKETFTTTQSLVLENSFGVIDSEDNVVLEVTVGINSDEYGWFEMYDVERGGDDWYAEGGLWIEDKKITFITWFCPKLYFDTPSVFNLLHNFCIHII